MPIAFRDASTGAGSGGSISIAKPPALVIGDTMLAEIGVTGTLTILPDGWTPLGDAGPGTPGDFKFYAKVADANDVATTFFSWGGGTGVAGGAIAAYSGAAAWGLSSVQSNTFTALHQAPGLTIADAGSMVVALFGFYNSATATSAWGPTSTERATSIGPYCSYVIDRPFGPGSSAPASISLSSPQSGGAIAIELFPVRAETTMQSAVTFAAEGQTYRGTTTIAQSVATMTAQAVQRSAGEVTMQAVARFTAEATGTHSLDFSSFDAYIETQNDFIGLLFDDSEKPRTISRRLQPVRQDVGNNPAEIRPEFGDIFAQNDFSHGGGQTYFHQLGRDPKRYFLSEGYDISEPGKLGHLHKLTPALQDQLTSSMTQANGLPMVAVGDRVFRGDGTLPGVWTPEDPAPGGGSHQVLSLATEGDRLFAALGTTGVHMRRADGAWMHHQPDDVTNLDINPANVVAWVKDRLMVIGGLGGRSIYEVVANPTPTPIDTLKEGWQFVSIGEAGGFIMACAINLDAGQSIIYSYGLNSSASAIIRKSSTPMPIGQLAWVVNGYIGTAFIGGGRANALGGYDPFLYRASVNAIGELDYTLIRQEKNSPADLSVRAITPLGESVLVSWTLGANASFGESRDGIAIYNLARDSFARHLKREGGGGANKILSILPYKGRVMVAIESFGVYFEDLTTVVDNATLVTSLADWNNAGNKVWDQIELSHDELPIGTAVTAEYTTRPQAVADWNQALLSQTPGSQGAVSRLSTTTSRVFALRITSYSSGMSYPVVQSFAVRSHPSPERPEWDIVRFIRLLSEDQKDDQGETIMQNPRERMQQLRRAVNTWVTFYESGVNWTAFLTDVSAYEPAQPFYDAASGEPLKDAFVVQLQMTGTEG